MGRKNNKTIMAAIIAGECTIIAAFIGTVSINIDWSDVISKNEWKEKYEKLYEDYNDLQNSYNELREKSDLLIEQTNFQNEDSTELIALKEENESLKGELSSLQDELLTLQNNISNIDNIGGIDTNDNSVLSESAEKISIFDMETFKGNIYWPTPDSEKEYTDTYGNEFITSRMGDHKSKTKNSKNIPVYLLENNYKKCEGQIAWPKINKNSTESAWLEFYSDDELIYQTEILTAESGPIMFEFSLENVEKLTVVRTSTKSYSNLYIIYPYFNFIK